MHAHRCRTFHCVNDGALLVHTRTATAALTFTHCVDHNHHNHHMQASTGQGEACWSPSCSSSPSSSHIAAKRSQPLSSKRQAVQGRQRHQEQQARQRQAVARSGEPSKSTPQGKGHAGLFFLCGSLNSTFLSSVGPLPRTFPSTKLTFRCHVMDIGQAVMAWLEQTNAHPAKDISGTAGGAPAVLYFNVVDDEPAPRGEVS